MITRSEVKRCAASSLESCKSCRVSPLSKEVEKCNVESSAYECMEQLLMKRGSLINNGKRGGDRTEPCGTLLLIGLGEKQ